MTTADQEQSWDGNERESDADRKEERGATLSERCSISIRGWTTKTRRTRGHSSRPFSGLRAVLRAKLLAGLGTAQSA